MAIEKSDFVVTLSKFAEFCEGLAVKFNKKLDATGVKNDDQTTDSGYVADARIVKTHGDEIDALASKVGDLYFDTDSSGKWGYKTKKNGAVTPFRNPTGNAVPGEVLSGKIFSSASQENAAGTMPNNGAWTGTTSGNGNVPIPAGYHNGNGYVSGAGAYNKGVSDADGRANADSANYKAGYSAGLANGNAQFNKNFTIVLSGGSVNTSDDSNGGKGISIGITVTFNPYTGAVSCSGGASAGARCFSCIDGSHMLWTWSQGASARLG